LPWRDSVLPNCQNANTAKDRRNFINPGVLVILAILTIYLGAQRLTANAIGNPTRTVCRIGPVTIEAGSVLGGQRWMAESGTTTQFIIIQTNSPYNNPAITGLCVRNKIRRLATK
jgi:hypothetical protein